MISTPDLGDKSKPMYGRSEVDFDNSIVNRIAVEKVLNLLSFEHRRVIELVVLDGVSLNDASKLLKLPLGTVKSRLFYALRNARNLLAEVA